MNMQVSPDSMIKTDVSLKTSETRTLSRTIQSCLVAEYCRGQSNHVWWRNTLK